MYTTSFDYRHYNPAVRLDAVPPEFRSDIPLRAQSVSLAQRPQSNYGRTIKSADVSNRLRYNKKLFHRRPKSTPPKKRRPVTKMPVKQQTRKTPEKVPCAVSVQTIAFPTPYADEPKTLSTSKRDDADTRTKYSNPLKQVSANRKLCQTAGATGTANRLLLQINEAEQVGDFERILNSNAILCERTQRSVWHRVAPDAPSATVLPRPHSTYSLRGVSEAYHYLFQQHEESLQPLIESYRRAAAEAPPGPSQSLLVRPWYDDLKDLSEFYEDDGSLKKEIETITDKIVEEEVKAAEETYTSQCRNFEVNLAGLIGLHVQGESLSPVHQGGGEDEDKEWPEQSMSADDSNKFDGVEQLAQNLTEVALDSNEKLPKITFSNCCEGCPTADRPNNTEVVIHLTVPSVDSGDEARPPIM